MVSSKSLTADSGLPAPVRRSRSGVSAVRILPMSSTIENFRDRGIADVQERLFLWELPRSRGRYRYIRSGLNAEPWTVVLFQFRARVIATAVFTRDEKFNPPRDGFGGVLHFEPDSIRTFDPIDVAGMRKVWPWFKAFGHAKQVLNPTLYPVFKRHLKHVKSPAREKFAKG